MKVEPSLVTVKFSRPFGNGINGVPRHQLVLVPSRASVVQVITQPFCHATPLRENIVRNLKNRELHHWWWWRQGQHLVKKDVYFTFEFRNYLNLLRSPIGPKPALIKRSTFSMIRRTWSFHGGVFVAVAVVVCLSSLTNIFEGARLLHPDCVWRFFNSGTKCGQSNKICLRTFAPIVTAHL